MEFRFGAGWLVFLLVSGLACAADAESPEASADQIEFFEKSVRPLLISACYECHGEKVQWSNLRLDSREHLLKGGDIGPAIVPGKPDQSQLIEAVRRTGDLKMPPEKPLNAEQIAILEKWVAMNAPWPKEEKKTTSREHLHRTHWAFQPVSRPAPPEVSNPDWCRTVVDAFVLDKLKASELMPSSPADRQTLIRRVTYDLTGLPPSSDEITAFVHDADPNAYPRLIDRLLQSPRYGEHWGRKWLDLARYSDTKGYMFGWEIGRFVHAANYRDWVINAFNTDLPYDRFLLLQMAADQVAADDPSSQVAMGFMTIGRRFLGNEHDIIDDRIDVLGRTTMGLTFGCARCHDHKYDPIPTADYYSLYGVFKNSTEQLTRAAPSPSNPLSAFEVDLKAKQELLNAAVQKMRYTIASRMRGKIGDYLVAALTPEKYPNIPFSQIFQEDDIFPIYVERVTSYLRQTRLNNHPVFVPWHRFAALSSQEFEAKATEVSRELQTLSRQVASPLVVKLFTEPPKTMREVAERYGRLLNSINKEWEELPADAELASTDYPTGLADADREAIRQVLYGPQSPCLVPNEGLAAISIYFAVRTELPEIWKLHTPIENMLLDTPGAPPFAVRLVDCEQIEEPRVFRRGNPLTRGDEVPRRFPQVVAGIDRQPFEQGSGRLELAKGIVAADNPLTARVWVNRIWQHHFGTGLVPTPSDFGTRAPTPKHLQLLDWLARKLVDEGWSTKAIHRQILLSSTYQQNAFGPQDMAIRERASQVDPENELIWKMNPHRLTFEELRDSMLTVSGELDLKAGGRGSEVFSAAGTNNRRSVYGFIDRQSLSNVYRVFDFANPDLHIPVRSETTVSQQALFAMNHPFVAARARHLVSVLDAQSGDSPARRIERLYEMIHQRRPTDRQTELALRFVSMADSSPQIKNTEQQLAWQYGYGALKGDATGIQGFQSLPFFNGTAWQGGEKFPDPKLGWAQLTAEGGHPGNDHNHAVIRRWTAAHTGTVSIDAQVKHEVAAGNGIRCWVISSRGGVLEQFTLHNSSKTLKIPSVAVSAQDTLDFVVDINGELNSDQHLCSIAINDVTPSAGVSESSASVRSWNSQRDFTGPPTQLLKTWEQLAQVLLLSNEFLFVD